MIRSRRLAALSLAAAAVLGACKDSTGPRKSTDSTSGTASFQYTGFTSGSFSASGAPPATSSSHPQFAAAQRDATSSGEGLLVLVGAQAAANGRTDLIELQMVEPSGPATLSLADDCGTSASLAGCAFALVGLNLDLTTSENVPGEQVFGTDAGTVRITQISSTHVQGTFSGHATDDSGNAITISGGAFDVPIVSADNPIFARAGAGPALSRVSPPRAARFAPRP